MNYFLRLKQRAAAKIRKATANSVNLFVDTDGTLKYKNAAGDVTSIASESGGSKVYKGILNSTVGAITKTDLSGDWVGDFYIDDISGSIVTAIIGNGGNLANAIITIGDQRRDTLVDTPHYLYYNDAGFWVLQYTDNSFYKTAITVEFFS